jgi:serpin B
MHWMENKMDMFKLELASRLPQNKDWIFSPYSIQTALSMLGTAASGETKQEILTTLDSNFVACKPTFDFVNNIFLQYDLVPKTGFDRADWYTELNSKYGEQSFPIMVDFENDSELIKNIINDHVTKLTNGKINNLLSSADVPPTLYMALISAIYFNDEWLYKFYEENTRLDSFNTMSGIIKLQFMSGIARCLEETDTYLMFSMPCKSGKEFIIVMPKTLDDILDTQLKVFSGEISFEKKFDRPEYVTFRMPKFKSNYIIDLIPILQNMGMHRCFVQDHAQFPYICGLPYQAWVAIIKHAALCEIDERGVTAAAVTYIGASGYSGSAGYKIREFIVNNPFFYAVRDENQNVLFLGKMTGEQNGS